MIWDGLRGHHGNVELFRRAAGRGRLAHAYAFVGAEGVGKATFADRLAACLVCSNHDDADIEACGECGNCRQWRAGSHPDVLRIGCPKGKKTIPISAIVGSDDRRGREGLCHDLALRPMSGRRRIAIIDEAHLLSRESANALLKTLEEPPRDSILILVANEFDSLLPTIRSRCQPMRFAPLSATDVAELLVEQGAVENAGEAERLAAVAEGSLSVAGQLLDPRIRDMQAQLRQRLAEVPLPARQLADDLTSGIESLGGDRQLQRRAAGWVIRFAIDFYRAALAECVRPGAGGEAGLRALADQARGTADAVEHIGGLMERCETASRQIDRNSPVPLVLEALFDDLALRTRDAAVAR